MKAFVLMVAAGAAAFAQLPAGEGKAVVEKRCTACHGVEEFAGRPLPKSGWDEVIERMVNRGAEGTDEEFDKIIVYLTNAFGPKVNVNKASARDFRTTLDFKAELAAAVVAYREKNGEFKSLDDLKKVPGVEGKEIDDRRGQIEF